MINPGGIPQIPGDMDALAKDAADLTGVGGDFAETGQRVNATWQGLAGVYKAPEAGELLAATAPVQSVSSSVGSDIKAVGSALTAYAAEVKQIQARLAQLKTEAENFVNSVKGDDDWRKDGDKIDKNTGLINAVSEAMAQFFEAQRRCANAINALYGGTQYKAVTGDKPKNDEYGYTADQLKEATKAGADLPWGKPEQHDEGFWGGVKHFFGGVGDGFMDMVKGLGGLIGWGENGWSWSNAGHAWGGLGKFALAIGVYAVPGGNILDQAVGVPGFKRGEMNQTLVTAGKGLVAWDDWSKDPARAGGKATFNIVTAVVGTKGAGAAMRGVGAAAEGSRIATVARTGTLMVRAGEAIGNLPTVTDLAVGAGRKFSALFDSVKGALHFDSPHVEIPHINEPAPHPHPTEHTPHPEPGSVGDNLGKQSTIPHESPINEPAHVGAGHGHDTPTNPHTGGGDHNRGGDHGGTDGSGGGHGDGNGGDRGNGGRDDGGRDDGGGDHGGKDDHDQGGQAQPHDPVKPPPGVTFDDPKHPNLGSDGKYYVAEGVDHDVPIDEPGNTGRTITDIDRPQDGVLWEQKSAVNAGDVNRWVNKHITDKIEAYIEARQHIAGYEHAPVGVEFTRAGADPAFRAAVEKAVADLRIKHPDVTILVKWAK